MKPENVHNTPHSVGTHLESQLEITFLFKFSSSKIFSMAQNPKKISNWTQDIEDNFLCRTAKNLLSH